MPDINIPTGAAKTAASAPSEGDIKSIIDQSSSGSTGASTSSITEVDNVVSPNKPEKSDVVAAIKESEDLITAVESVAAMYGIPSSNIIQDDSINSLRVVEDHIMVPTTSSKPTDNGKAIIQSIGAVLDYISQRVDNKLNDFQSSNIEKSRIEEDIKSNADPSKGKVISRHVDSNGDEILVYDSGLVDMANTREAHAKVDELRAIGSIPEHKYDPDGWMNTKTSYFTDEDDITNGTDLSADNNITPDTGADMSTPSDDLSGATPTDVSASINESYSVLDTISKHNNTRHLGYDIMMEQGFNFVKPVEFFQESAKKNNSPTDIKHMKFDNTNILKAIKYMNEARAEQSGVKKGRFNIEQFINSSKYQKAVDCLNKQFDARLNIRFFKTSDGGNTAFTSIFNDIKTHLTVSKSKGFQLGGLPIDICIVNTALDEDAPDDISLFGQSVISVICHEIFHNIMAVMKSKQSQFTASLATTMAIAQDIPSAKNRRKLMTNFVDSLDEIDGIKLNPINRRALVKHLTYLSAIAHDEKAVNEYEAAIKSKSNPNTIDEQIERMEKRVRKIKMKTYGPGRYVMPVLAVAGATVAMIAAPVELMWLTGILFGMSGGYLFGTGIVHAVEIDTVNKFKKGDIKNLEEHWCDMFAAMYNLPVTFFMIGKPRKGSSADFALDQLKRYDELEREAMQLSLIKYPTISERNHAAVKYAKKTLDSKCKLDPAIKKYLEWIVANYSKNLDMDIDTIYSKGTFDPKTAEDLDKHIQNIIGSANITVTEYDISWLNDDEPYQEGVITNVMGGTIAFLLGIATIRALKKLIKRVKAIGVDNVVMRDIDKVLEELKNGDPAEKRGVDLSRLKKACRKLINDSEELLSYGRKLKPHIRKEVVVLIECTKVLLTDISSKKYHDNKVIDKDVKDFIDQADKTITALCE